MKHERVQCQNVDLDQLQGMIRDYLTSQGFQIIHTESTPAYRSIHGRKASLGRTLIGAVRDAEVDIAGTNQSFELTLRTGAWGRDIAIPAIEGFIFLGGVGAIGAGAAGAIFAHEFEKHFWTWLESTVAGISSGAATLGKPFSPTMVPANNLPNPSAPLPSGGSPSNVSCPHCGGSVPAGARYCQFCGSPIPT